MARSRTAPPLELAVELARDAGTLLEGYAERLRAGSDLEVSAKTSATDPVSDADRAAERLISERLTATRPDDGLLGEEGQGGRDGSSGYRWVVDPLDGTVNFLYARHAWSVSVACEDTAGGLLAVVHHPPSGETFTAERGAGAHLAGRALAVTQVGALASCLVATGFAYDAEVRADQGRDLADLVPRVRDVRRDGSAALDLAWLAAGRHDGYLEFALNPWDWAAGSLIAQEAGAVLTSHERVLGGRRRRGVVAGGPAAHAALVAWLEMRP